MLQQRLLFGFLFLHEEETNQVPVFVAKLLILS